MIRINKMHQLHFGNNPTDFSGFLEKKKEEHHEKIGDHLFGY